jgi:tryptophan synthase alpha chain
VSTSRITQTFETCRAQGRTALVAYLTAYDPDRAGSLARLLAACEAGVDILELGVPFSDPTADGPAIQAAMVRARAAGATLDSVLDLAAAVRERFPTLPIVLFSYANPLLRGCERDPEGAQGFCNRLAAIGVDALLVVDLPPEHAAVLREPARAAGLDWIGLIAPTSTPARREQVLAHASGFVYAVSLTGVTGAALDAGGEALHVQLDGLRARSPVPVVVGFGVREPAQVAALAPSADGVVVGSALVLAGCEGVDALARAVAGLRTATRV